MLKRHRPLDQPPSREVIEAWRLRRQMLIQAIERGESASDAWLWQIRIEVLDYMLHQYGRETPPVSHTARATRPIPAATAAADSETQSGIAFDPPRPAPTADHKPTIDTGMLRQRLRSLHQSNETVRANRAQPINLPPPIGRHYNPLTMRWETWDAITEAELFSAYVDRLDQDAVAALNRIIESDLGLMPDESPRFDPQLVADILREHGLDAPGPMPDPSDAARETDDA